MSALLNIRSTFYLCSITHALVHYLHLNVLQAFHTVSCRTIVHIKILKFHMLFVNFLLDEKIKK